MATVFLIGFPGCGKTTLGEVTANVLNCPFTDLDEFIEQQAGQTVMEIFSSYGEEYFRRLERQALRELASQSGIVACGGGTPCDARNMALMNDRGITVWLTTPTERLISRLCLPEHRSKRPQIATFTDDEIATYVRNTVAKRTPHYAKAKLQFDSTRIETADETQETALELAALLRHYIK